MDKLKEIGDLITAATATTKACKDAYTGAKAYRRHPRRLAYSLSELLTETTTLHAHTAQLHDLVEELCTACIPCKDSNGAPSALAGTSTMDSHEEDTNGA